MLSAKEVAKKLVEINAIRVNPDEPFQWASGLYSPIYCDNRTILSFPEFRAEIKESLCAAAADMGDYDKIAGVATAGIAHGALMADHTAMPFIYVRSKPKGHGTKSQIEGVLTAGERCIVVEDLISTGGSSIKAVDVLRAEDAVVTGVLAIFSYGFDSAVANFEEANCPYKTLSNYSALIEVLAESGKMTDKQIASLKEWRLDPKAWSASYESKQN